VLEVVVEGWTAVAVVGVGDAPCVGVNLSNCSRARSKTAVRLGSGMYALNAHGFTVVLKQQCPSPPGRFTRGTSSNSAS
jgi:hypothetical protein